MVWARILFKASYFNRTKFIMMSCSKNFSSRGDLFFFVFFAGLFLVRWLDWIFNGAQPQSVTIKSTAPLTKIKNKDYMQQLYQKKMKKFVTRNVMLSSTSSEQLKGVIV